VWPMSNVSDAYMQTASRSHGQGRMNRCDDRSWGSRIVPSANSFYLEVLTFRPFLLNKVASESSSFISSVNCRDRSMHFGDSPIVVSLSRRRQG